MSEKPEIIYPCPWGYRLIGTSETEIRAAVARAVGDAAHELELSNTSAQGRYVAMKLTVQVQDEDQRLGIDKELNADPAIRMVL